MDKRNTSLTDLQDPLGLRELPPLVPPEDDWPGIAAALAEDRSGQTIRPARLAVLAVAASAVLAVALLLNGPAPVPMENGETVATIEEPVASGEQEQTLKQLIAVSQNLESQLRGLREGSGSIPASSAVYVAELEDLVAQVDNRISVSPDSINLWGQRVNLLLDLTQIYQHQWEREYGRMASL